jgi:hypothetical protein
MATFEQEQEQGKKVESILIELNKIKPESLIRTDELGKALSFESGLPVFERILGLFKDLSEVRLDNAPFEVLNQLTNLAQQALNQFQKIQKFSVQQNPSNPAQIRDQLIEQLRDQWNAYYGTITPHIAYAIRRGTDFDSLEREARGTLSLQNQIVTDLQTEKDQILSEMKGALEQVRRAAAEAGVAQHAIHFKTEAELYRKQAYLWLGAVCAFGVLTIIYAYSSVGPELHEIAATGPIGKLVPIAISRVIVISILVYGLVWSARNYTTSRHNFVINRHRQNALSTFETFAKASSDKQTKDAVLLQATQSIFAPQSSGYVKGESEPQPGGHIIEIMRGMTGAKE